MTSSDDRPILLEARDVVVHYGRIKALHGVSLVVHEGELDAARLQRRGQNHDDAGDLGFAPVDVGGGVVRGA